MVLHEQTLHSWADLLAEALNRDSLSPGAGSGDGRDRRCALAVVTKGAGIGAAGVPSHWPPQPPAPLPPPKTAAPSSVSYTHLTLPTILLV
eukprot:4929018-Pyramimonas_sp.AAC.1